MLTEYEVFHVEQGAASEEASVASTGSRTDFIQPTLTPEARKSHRVKAYEVFGSDNPIRVDVQVVQLYNMGMEIIVDTSIFLAVALNEPEKAGLIELTEGAELVAPRVMPYEAANALSAMVKRQRITLEEAKEAFEIVQKIPVKLVELDISSSVELAGNLGIYAYDAFFIETSMEHRRPLLTLDVGMKNAAKKAGIRILE